VTPTLVIMLRRSQLGAFAARAGEFPEAQGPHERLSPPLPAITHQVLHQQAVFFLSAIAFGLCDPNFVPRKLHVSKGLTADKWDLRPLALTDLAHRCQRSGDPKGI
jgi:hypothetical protein